MIEDLEKFNKQSDAKIIKETAIYQYLQNKGNTFFCSSLDKIATNVSSILTRIPAMFSNYTNHDITHSLRIADYMVSLLPKPIENYSDTELVIMLISAIYHDIGMTVFETEIDLDSSKQDEIRIQHHERSEDYVIHRANNDYFKINNDSEINFKSIIAKIVRAHGENVDWIKENISDSEEYGVDKINPLFISCLLRLGDYLDFDSRRTPYCLFKYLKLKTHSYEEWKKHFPIYNFKKINEQRQLYFTGACEEPEVYHRILHYFRNIEEEIQNEKLLLEGCEEKHKLDISDIILNKIEHKTFTSVDLQFDMDYIAISNLLMGENLYPDRKVVIRELVQNSIDACLIKNELLRGKIITYHPEIKVIKDENKITITDNGIGMSKNVIKNYFLCVGKSFYTSDSYKQLNCNYNPISHYGIGFLSCFLLTDRVDIRTIPYDDTELCYMFSITKNERDVLIQTEEGKYSVSGTSITITNKFADEVFMSLDSIIEYIKILFVKLLVPIKVYDKTGLVQQISIVEPDSKKRIDISKYLNKVNCSFKILGEKDLYRILNNNNPFRYPSYFIYDTQYLLDSILDRKDLCNYEQASNNIYDVSHLLLPNGKIQILEIFPLGSDAEDYYERALEYEDNEQDAFDKTFERYGQELLHILIEDRELLNEFDEYQKINFLYISGSERYKKFVSEIKKLFEKMKINADSFICNISIEHIFQSSSFYSYVNIDKKIESGGKNILSIRNIRIFEYRLLVPSIIDSQMTAQWHIDVNTDGIYPNVSRSGISSKLSAELAYALGYAYHMYFMENESDPAKKEFLSKFIAKFYSQDSIFINVTGSLRTDRKLDKK
ncbi:HD domain-containing protein [Treponema socranskii]|uniref:HD domain-containing protein n=1 Tax=Treponema socranskii TaxID=53419 RepID=UPI003D91EAEB